MAPNIQDAKCILVVGATSGIGRALALALLDLPHSPTVIITGRREERLRELAEQHKGKKLEYLPVDIDSTPQELQAFVDSTTRKYPEVCTSAKSSYLAFSSDQLD
jgi:NADP-dependent 3-hydroxy acid dehydrogenase YdfG